MYNYSFDEQTRINYLVRKNKKQRIFDVLLAKKMIAQKLDPEFEFQKRILAKFERRVKLLSNSMIAFKSVLRSKTS